MVKTYSLKKDGNTVLSKNFKVKEFACRDGADEVKIDEGLIKILQTVRDKYKKAVTVVSGYRTPSYNSVIDGATFSQHKYGKAADIQITGVKPREIAEYLESLKVKGLGLYDYAGGFVHVDTRLIRSRWLQLTRGGDELSSKGFYPAPIEKPQDKPLVGVVNTLFTSLNVRAYASLFANRIGSLKKGTQVEIIGKASNGWYKIKYCLLEGFVSAKYIKLV